MIRHVTASAIAALAFAAFAQAASADVVFLDKQQPLEFMTHRLVGNKVLNAQAEEIGDVRDVIVNTQGTATAVVIGVGGYLGIAEKLVAVPFASVEIGDVVQSSRVVVVPVTKDQLKAAPTFAGTDPAMTDRAKQTASDWFAAAKSKALDLAKKAQDKAKELAAPK